MVTYIELLNNPPKITIPKGVKEIVFHIVSCMCDNKYILRLKKNENGEFSLNGMGQSLSNFQLKHKPYEIEWAADSGSWKSVIRMINSGTATISHVDTR